MLLWVLNNTKIKIYKCAKTHILMRPILKLKLNLKFQPNLGTFSAAIHNQKDEK